MILDPLIEMARALAARPGVRRAIKLAQAALFLGVVVYLIVQLSAVGWGDVFSALPGSPWFYLIFTIRYFLQPLSEIPAYELVWKTPLWRHWTAFIRKRVYNFAVMGYSGEAFFTLWARRRLALSDRDIVVGVKDNNLVSALVSNAATALVVVALFFLGDLERELAAIPAARRCSASPSSRRRASPSPSQCSAASSFSCRAALRARSSPSTRSGSSSS